MPNYQRGPSMPTDEKVKVRIMAESRIRISQVRMMRVADWNKYREMYDGAATDRQINKAFEGYIDPGDIMDSDDWEDVQIELVKDAQP